MTEYSLAHGLVHWQVVAKVPRRRPLSLSDVEGLQDAALSLLVASPVRKLPR